MRNSFACVGRIQFKLLPILLVSLVIFLQYHLWLGNGSIRDITQLKKQLAQQTQENAMLKKQNDELLRQVHYVQANQDAIESRARQELGMIKKGETFYQVMK
jgi:cell division protein FtsB